MIRIKCDGDAERAHAQELIGKIEALRGRRLFCIYHDQIVGSEILDDLTVMAAREALEEVGQVEKLTVLIDSPGGDPDATFRLIKTIRRFTTNLEVIVVNWAKSAATLFCLGADKILMSPDAELGPLDAQLRSPKDGRQFSALNAFKSLEYLRQYGIEVLDIVSLLFKKRVGMDYIHAVEAARPMVSDIVTSLYGQVSPAELGESRRYLAVGEQYGKTIMERYSYCEFHPSKIEEIVRTLVWNYPSHGFVIDIEEAKRIGLKVEPLDSACTALCEELLATVSGCIGMVSPETKAVKPAEVSGDGDLALPSPTLEKEVKNEEEAAPITSNGNATSRPK